VTDDSPLLFDATRLIWRRWRGRLPTGIDRVCLAYLRHFGARSQAVAQHDRFRGILDKAASEALFDLLEEPPDRFRMRLIGGALRHLGGLNCDGGDRLYLNIGHTGLDSPGFRQWVARSHVRPVYLVHDLIPITHPEFCRPGEADRHRERMRTVLTTATGVIGNSEATIHELSLFADSEGLPKPPMLAQWLGVDPLPAARAAPFPERPTFAVVGTIEGRKNHLMLLGIWSRLVERLGNRAPRLLIIGQRGWEADRVFETLDDNEKLRGHVVELNHCSDEELAQHLTSARALLFPSLVEGFGLPLVEALDTGAPVIASDLPVFREIGRNIPTYLAPTDAAAWEASILDYASAESETRAAQLRRIKDFRAPTWSEHFAAVEEWLATLG
jgi:glycosyltransferase involved in cell wall biosynthesis